MTKEEALALKDGDELEIIVGKDLKRIYPDYLNMRFYQGNRYIFRDSWQYKYEKLRVSVYFNDAVELHIIYKEVLQKINKYDNYDIF